MRKHSRMTEEQIKEKLARSPLWIQQLGKQLMAERDDALAQLTKKQETDKPTPFYTVSYSGSERIKHYIDTDRLTVQHAGVELGISIDKSEYEPAIEIRFGTPDSLGASAVVLQPNFSNAVRFINVLNLAEVKRHTNKGNKGAKSVRD